jgi:hypothetical protein
MAQFFSTSLQDQLASIGLDKDASHDLMTVLLDGLKSDTQFPVPFDNAWRWLGYSTKGNALRTLLSLRLNGQQVVEGVNFSKCSIPCRGPLQHRYLLSATCFRTFALTAGSRRGELVRDFYVALGREYSTQLAAIRGASDLSRLQESTADQASAFQARQTEILTQALPPAVRIEKLVAERLGRMLGGCLEVASTYGRIDVLTHREVIEVKRFALWKAALGQVLVYHEEYPHLTARLHLFLTESDELSSELAGIVRLCARQKVSVTFEMVSVADLLRVPQKDNDTNMDEIKVTNGDALDDTDTGTDEIEDTEDDALPEHTTHCTKFERERHVIKSFIREFCIVDPAMKVASTTFRKRLLEALGDETPGMRITGIVVHALGYKDCETMYNKRRCRGFAGLGLKPEPK